MCLNPYYTGIHLHRDWLCGYCKRVCVLILIILEYIYIPHRSRIKPSKNEVLILIILEYIYMINIKYKNPSFESLNPYYTGIHLHVIFSGISVYILLS